LVEASWVPPAVQPEAGEGGVVSDEVQLATTLVRCPAASYVYRVTSLTAASVSASERVRRSFVVAS
jgi:hypothetical protein